ncbi:MAG: DMT family transporter [Lachnospiraceae bacterium]|nr:DMT family transporter [Lachnospiraceae bacterium]
MKRITFRSTVLLLSASLIWGFAFIAQSVGMDYLGPFSFNGTRFILGCSVLAPLAILRARIAKKRGTQRGTRKDLIIAGLSCGVVVCIATSLQQVGIMYTSVGKAGFITTLYIIIVPIMGVFLKRRVDGIIWVGAIIAAVGVYLLCIHESFTLNRGDVYIFICAFVFSVHILLIAHFAPRVDGVALSCLQFLVAGIICVSIGYPLEKPIISDFTAGIWPLLYTGILSSGIAFTLQIVGQRDADPSVASLIFSLESVFAVIGGYLLLNQNLTSRELVGCAIMFAAVVLVQLPIKLGSKKRIKTEYK